MPQNIHNTFIANTPVLFMPITHLLWYCLDQYIESDNCNFNRKVFRNLFYLVYPEINFRSNRKVITHTPDDLSNILLNSYFFFQVMLWHYRSLFSLYFLTCLPFFKYYNSEIICYPIFILSHFHTSKQQRCTCCVEFYLFQYFVGRKKYFYKFISFFTTAHPRPQHNSNYFY